MFVPWVPRYTREEASWAIARSRTWADALRLLGVAPRGKNFQTLKKWAAAWEIPVDHLPSASPRRTGPAFSEKQARAAIAASLSWAEALRRLDYCPSGGNPATLKRWAETWGISTEHFDPHAASLAGLRRHGRRRRPLREVLTEDSTINRGALKERLYEEGLKERACELCGQDEEWRGKRISLIIDHVNGVRDDNRLENLRIVCPNCAATLDTHCGRAHPGRLPAERKCERCGNPFRPKYGKHRYCSRDCGSRWDRRDYTGVPRPGGRKAERPVYEQLLQEIDALGYLAVGRKYGVSDNAIRKWVRQYERERAIASGRDPDIVEIPRRTWPNRRREAAESAQPTRSNTSRK
jgi:HNH endonuclease